MVTIQTKEQQKLILVYQKAKEKGVQNSPLRPKGSGRSLLLLFINIFFLFLIFLVILFLFHFLLH
jgi:hypothetical protein